MKREHFNFFHGYFLQGLNIMKLVVTAGISGLKYLTDLIKDGSMSKEVINWTQNDLEKQFVTNKAAMIIDGPWINRYN